MAVRTFADTNIVVYAESADKPKSVTRKHGFVLSEAYEVAASLLDLCEVVPVAADTVREAMRIGGRYGLSHWDALIVAAALLAKCDTLYSEDLQHGQVFEGAVDRHRSVCRGRVAAGAGRPAEEVCLSGAVAEKIGHGVT